jgi:arsenite-transporting ATPase
MTAFLRSSPASAPQYFYFGGKGGNGKTTCAAATAVALAARGRRVLLVSTDPAHALGDILDRKLTARPSALPARRGTLKACELDADRALARWLTRRRPELAAIFQRGTILERTDIDRFLKLSLPGVDELLGLLEIERLAATDAYDDVVVDTAPTGHTLRLLATPALFATIARVLDVMQEKHRALAVAFSTEHRTHGDQSDALIDELRRDGERLHALLRHRSRTRLCWVLLAEELSVAESRRALATLTTDGISPSDIIVNRVTPPPPSACALCNGRRRYEAQWLNAIADEWGRQEIALWTLPGWERPPRGLAALRRVIAPDGAAAAQPGITPLRKRVRSRAQRTSTEHPGAIHQLPAAVRPSRATQLLIVGGKGGVGKTTCAAALALSVARAAPDRRVLLVSTDPAHSLGDVLGLSAVALAKAGERVGDVERRLAAGKATLAVREIDAAAGWREWRARYRESIAAVFARLAGPHADLAVDRVIVEELFELAPPGMDEVVGLLAIVDALTREKSPFDLVIVDSAPTGHTLRLLELPAQAHAWVRQIMSVMLKYHLAAGADGLSAELVWLSKGLTRLETLLTNPRASGFVVVTRPEQLPTLQTLRLVDWLRDHRIPRRALIVNGVTPPGCARCRRIAARERRHIAAFAREAVWKKSGGAVVVTEAIASPPRGVASLTNWARTWRSEN